MISRQLRERRNWICFFVLGTVNNLMFVIINSAALSIVTAFHQENNIAAVTWASVGVGVLARMANTIAIPYLSYATRVWIFAIITTFGLLCLAFAFSFWFALLSITCCGMACSFGESLFLGYLPKFSPSSLNAWSSGTGMAGLLGSSLYILFQALKMSNRSIFLTMIPFSFLYLIAFYAIVVPPAIETDESIDEEEETNPLLNNERKTTQDSHQINYGGDSEHILSNNNSNIEEGDESLQKETGFKRFQRCMRIIYSPSINLLLIYFFEYCISTGFAAKVLKKDGDYPDTFAYKQFFPILSFCYQFGVFISRSSLQCFRIRQFTILTIIQGINFMIWLFVDRYKFINLYVLFVFMVFVGLLGGASYVNIFNELSHHYHIPRADKELSTNIAAIFITMGITLACIFDLAIFNTWLKNE